MSNNRNILDFFVSINLGDLNTPKTEKENASEKGKIFRSYIWGDTGISRNLKKLNQEKYGKDVQLILYKFYVNPAIELESAIKKIENYTKREKAIGVPIIINDINFFNQPHSKRILFLINSILNKLEILNDEIDKKNLDTNLMLLKEDMIDSLKELDEKKNSSDRN